MLKTFLTVVAKEDLEKMANEFYIEKLIKIVPSEGLNNISYAQDMLIKMIKDRTLRSFCIKNNIPNMDIYRMATGERLPAYSIILALCEVIPPILWFTGIDDPKPRAKKITFNPEKQDYKNTLGFKKFQNLRNEDFLELKIDRMAVHRFKTGKTGILTFKRMLEFSPKINPVDWFIFEG